MTRDNNDTDASDNWHILALLKALLIADISELNPPETELTLLAS